MNTKRWWTIAACACLCTAVRAEVRYTVTDLGPGTGDDVNNKGQVPLYITSSGAPIGPTYLWDGAQFAYIPISSLPVGLFTSVVTTENDKGQLAGWAGNPVPISAAGNADADTVFWESGASQPPVVIGEVSAVGLPAYMNASGHLLLSHMPGGSFEAYALWSSATGVTPLTTLGGQGVAALGLNDADVVVGSSQTSDGIWHAVTWQNGEVHQLDDGTWAQSEAVAIANDGEIAGVVVDNTNHTQLALWSPAGTLQTFDISPTVSFQVNRINSAHQVVGWIGPNSVLGNAYLFENGTVLLLKDLVPAGNNVVLTNAVDINENGQILVRGHIPSGDPDNPLPRTVLLTPVSSMARALSIAGGLHAASASDLGDLDLQSPAGISLTDAVRLARKAAGLQ